MNTKKNLLLTSAATLLVVVVIGGVLYATGNLHFGSGPTAQQKAAVGQQNAQQKQQFLNGQSGTNSPSDNSESNPSSASDDLQVSTSRQGSSMIVKTQFHTVTSGTCDLKITNGTRSTEQKAQVIYQPQFSSCAGFSVPISSLGTGTWSIALTVTSDTGAVLTSSTTAEVQ